MGPVVLADPLVEAIAQPGGRPILSVTVLTVQRTPNEETP